jgi:uncharacterized integral membrane protein
MKSFKLILLLVLMAVFTVIVLQNQAAWEVRFLWIEGELPGIIMLFLTTAIGFISGITVALLVRRDSRKSKN